MISLKTHENIYNRDYISFLSSLSLYSLIYNLKYEKKEKYKFSSPS